MGKKSGINTQKIMKYVRLAALAAPYAAVAMDGTKSPRVKVLEGLGMATGIDPNTGQFNAAYLAKGWLPFLASTAVTYGIPKLAGMIRGL